MDELKDTHRTDSVSRYIEQYAVRTNPFGENRAADRAYRRAERIAAGVHMLTSHISSEEPLRNSARATSAKMLTNVLNLRNEMRSAHSQCVAELHSTIRYLISLVRIMGVSGFVSQQNASTVVEALDELGAYILSAQRSILSENVSLSREDLVDVPVPSRRPPRPAGIKDMTNTASIKDESPMHKDRTMSDGPHDALGSLSIRVQNILDILKAGGSLGIKDISANLPEYSEKMIQRELLDLVARGAIKKTGLKRWSKYSLVA